MPCRDLDEAVKLAKQPDVQRRLTTCAYDVLWDTFTHFQAGKVSPQELLTAMRLAKSVDYSVGPLRSSVFARMPGRDWRRPTVHAGRVA